VPKRFVSWKKYSLSCHAVPDGPPSSPLFKNNFSGRLPSISFSIRCTKRFFSRNQKRRPTGVLSCRMFVSLIFEGFMFFSLVFVGVKNRCLKSRVNRRIEENRFEAIWEMGSDVSSMRRRAKSSLRPRTIVLGETPKNCAKSRRS